MGDLLLAFVEHLRNIAEDPIKNIKMPDGDLNLALEAHDLGFFRRNGLLNVAECLLEHWKVRTTFARCNLVRHVAKRLFISILDMLDVKDRSVYASQQAMRIRLEDVCKTLDGTRRLLLLFFRLRHHVQKADVVIRRDLGSQTSTKSSKIVRQFAFVDITVNRRLTSIDLVEIKHFQEVEDERILRFFLLLGRFYVFQERARL